MPKLDPKSACGAILAAAITLGCMVPGTLKAQTATVPGLQSDPDTTVVAIVGSERIYLAEILAMARRLPEQAQNMPLQAVYPQLLQRAVDSRLVTAAGRAAGYADNDQVKEQLRFAEDQIIREVFLREQITGSMSEEKLQDLYTQQARNFSGEEEVKARHILVDSEEEARAIIEELDAGADFSELAQDRSTGPSAASGGDLGWFGPGQMVPEFSTAAFALEPGGYTGEPVKTQFGWHVILAEDRRESEVPSFEDVRPQLANMLTQQLLVTLLEKLRADAEIERFNYDGGPYPVNPQSSN